MAIGVTGASGGVGSRVVRHLLARGSQRVVALARRRQAVLQAGRLTVRAAEYDDPRSLRNALADLSTLVFISSDGVAESMRRHHEHVVAAALGAGVDHIVYTSIVDVSPDSRFYYATVHREQRRCSPNRGCVTVSPAHRSSPTSSSRPGSNRPSTRARSRFRPERAGCRW